MTLEPTFSLTPRSSSYFAITPGWVNLQIHGISIFPNYHATYPGSFDNQHEQDQVLFLPGAAADPLLDYREFSLRQMASHVYLSYNLSAFGAEKELAVVFGVKIVSRPARLLIYSNDAQLDDVTLALGDNQFLIEIESLHTSFSLYFIHARNPDSSLGGEWFFRGITGYVI
jgi:hypothetical protein